MTCLGAGGGLLAVLCPQQRGLLIVVTAAFFIAAVLSFVQAVRLHYTLAQDLHLGAALITASACVALFRIGAPLPPVTLAVITVAAAAVAYWLEGAINAILPPGCKSKLMIQTPPTDNLAETWHGLAPVDMLTLAFRHRAFALLHVRNVSRAPLSNVIVRCRVQQTDSEIPCFWSKESGRRFRVGGSHSADLNVDDDRVLLIAQAFGDDKYWARLPEEQADLKCVALRPSAELGESVELHISFRAEGLDCAQAVRLGFEVDDAAVQGGYLPKHRAIVALAS